MLVLTGKIGDSFIIGDGEITVRLLKDSRTGVFRLGFEDKTKPSVSIHREKIFQRIKEEGKPNQLINLKGERV